MVTVRREKGNGRWKPGTVVVVLIGEEVLLDFEVGIEHANAIV